MCIIYLTSLRDHLFQMKNQKNQLFSRSSQEPWKVVWFKHFYEKTKHTLHTSWWFQLKITKSDFFGWFPNLDQDALGYVLFNLFLIASFLGKSDMLSGYRLFTQ